MSAVVLDTHALIWMLVDPPKLSSAATDAIKQAVMDGEPVCFSSISIVEICYLIEKGRFTVSLLDQLLADMHKVDSALEVIFVTDDIALTLRKIPRDIVPDMPDRIIAATALEMGFPLVTRDHKIIASGIPTIW
jgi:PIN domain nuclease of toxin-antitoxin system